MWYIVKLGGLFRVIVIQIFGAAINCICPTTYEEPSGGLQGRSVDFRETTILDLEDLEMENRHQTTKVIQQDKNFVDASAATVPSKDFEPTSPDPKMQKSNKLSIFGIIMLETNAGIQQQMKEDKRFHPILIGAILVIFLLVVSVFISHMENIGYFDSFYACFITYSTIGFGDIDIFGVSYRSNWFNHFFYGNLIHITGYMILSAWISSILDKFGVRKY